MANISIGRDGCIALPVEVQERYQLTSGAPLRLVETRTGILLIPLTEEPMSRELQIELADWQALSQETWNSFPYEAAEE